MKNKVTVEMSDVGDIKSRDEEYDSGETDNEQKLLFATQQDEEESSGYEEIKLTLAQACGLNTMNMFGTGPFITIPFVVAAADPPGPQALIGYALAAFACMNDSLVWSEIGSMWPDSGGSYVYLREMYGPHTYGRLMAFLFVWQIMVSGPMECASGFIATAQYLAYIDKDYSYWHHSGIAFAMCVATVWALYREIDDVGTITLVLWAFTICAICFAITAGYTTFETKYIRSPDDAFSDPSKFFVSLGVAARFAVYDFTGYYDVNFVGKEVQNPSETIPIACVTTCCVVAMIFFLVDVAVIGSLEWNPDNDGYVKLVTSGDDSANYIMALFCETHIGEGFAIFFTIIVAITIFGSCFSFMIGLAQIPYTAAKDGYFYDFLAHEHEHYRGLSDYSLLFVGLLSTVFCFLDLEIVIEGMLTMQLLIQFMAQGFGLMYYRYLWPIEDQETAPFSCPMFPFPCIVQLIIFGFIFCTTDTYVFHGNAPLLEVALAFLLSGVVMYHLWARSNGFWPFNIDKDTELEEWEHMVVYVAGDNEDEFTILKHRLAIRENEITRLQELSENSYKLIHDKDRDLAVSNKSLDNKAYKIMQLTRKLGEQESKIEELTKAYQEVSKRNTRAHIKNDEMRRRLHELQAQYGILEEDEDDITDGDEANEDIYSWSVTDVLSWWRKNLPKSAQTYCPVVRECQMTGRDLLELDMGMLQQFGMKKLLAKQIMSQIEPLRIEAEARKIDPSYAKVFTQLEKEEDEELTRLRGLDKVNPTSQAKMTGLLTNVLRKHKDT